MNISSVRYYKDQEINSDGEWVSVGDNVGLIIIIDGKEYHAPLNPANRHYAEVMRQVEEGTLTIEEAE